MRNFFKLLGIIAVVAVIWFSMASCLVESKDKENDGSSTTDDGGGNDGGKDGGGSGGINPTITIKNSTGYAVNVYIKASTEVKDWGYNRLDYSWSTLDDGKTYDITLSDPLTVCKVYDIRLTGGGYNFIKYGYTIANKMTITFTTGDLNNMSTLPKITIQNRTGKWFDSVKIRPSGTTDSDWRDYGGIGSNSDNDNINILIPPTNYTSFDIQTTSSNPTSTYTKTNVSISNGMKILFTNIDRVNSSIEAPVIVIQNDTGYSVKVYIRNAGLTGSSSWGDNRLSYSWSTIDDGTLYAISNVSGSTIDIKLADNTRNFIKTNVQVVDGQIYRFTTSDVNTNPEI